jgi:hypothetical protein
MMRPSLILGLACLVCLAGCGIKSPPIESSKLAPQASGTLEASPVPQGVRVGFKIPSADSPSQRIEEAILLRGYLPPEGDPDCPPCPPRLTKKVVFDLTRKLKGLEGDQFTWLDEEAPENRQAVYQVILVDAAGRKSPPSGYARAFRLPPPAPPKGLTARMGENQVSVRWMPVTTLAKGGPLPGAAQYVVFRRGPDGIHQLSSRGQSSTDLTDKTVITGQKYAYRVAAARVFGNHQIVGDPGPWVTASEREGQALRPPSGLMGASQTDGIYLRFTPSPDREATGYLVQRATQKEGPFKTLNQQPVLENTFVDHDSKPGLRVYRVLAVGEMGDESEPSETLEIRHQP